MKVILTIADRDICTIEIWEDKAPTIAAALRDLMPLSSIAQHGKIVGDLLFFSLPVVLPPENALPLQDLCRQRRESTGSAGGSVCFYNPRQQICVYYGDDLADEPFDVSYIGEVIEDQQAMYIAGVECWSRPGAVVTMRLV